MRVLFCGAWDEGDGYPRARALRDGLRAAGVEVAECRATGMGRDKQRLLRQPWRWPLVAVRQLLRRFGFRRALRRALVEHRPAVVVVPYPGHLVIHEVRRQARVPVVLDLFLSAYDTAVTDRGLVGTDSLAARLLRSLDRRACETADLVLVDTPENAGYLSQLTGVRRDRFDWLPVGDPQAPARPAAYGAPTGGRLSLLFFGTGVPLHGLAVLIDAVARAPHVELTLVGGSPVERDLARQALGDRLRLLPEFVARARLQELLDAAALVAGVFSAGDKARRVVPFKVVHALAAGRPVITAHTPAVRRLLSGSDGEDGIFLVPPGDAAALAGRLEALASNPAALAAAASSCRALYDREFAVARTGQRLRAMLDSLDLAADSADSADPADGAGRAHSDNRRREAIT